MLKRSQVVPQKEKTSNAPDSRGQMSKESVDLLHRMVSLTKEIDDLLEGFRRIEDSKNK